MTEFNQDHVESIQYRSLDMHADVSNHTVSFQTWALTLRQTREHNTRCTTVITAVGGDC
jgi:hypothetical protein